MNVSRRDMITWLGLGAAATPALAGKPVPADNAPTVAPFRGLEAGMTLFNVWSVDAVFGPTHGAVAVHLRDGEHAFRLDVLKRDDTGPKGVGQSRTLAVYVCNQGGPTVEREGQAAMALAAWLQHYETTGLPVPSLQTLRERERAQL
ncbi:MAG: hypothetical protein U0228_26825 [Myxococcaceae bacterium]